MFESFPTWAYGPNGQSGIFQTAEEIPAGWMDSPAKVQETEPEIPPAPEVSSDGPEIFRAPDVTPLPSTLEMYATPEEDLPPEANPWETMLPPEMPVEEAPQPATESGKKTVRKLGARKP
jgi:hypothetical protein